jgi:hypothetical protein
MERKPGRGIYKPFANKNIQYATWQTLPNFGMRYIPFPDFAGDAS